ncbi:MAG: GHKL domain-containing protein [Calditrichaeota bacterium]|nr:MAG: GHKL domain-containing protein [Calditrichota bacterium]
MSSLQKKTLALLTLSLLNLARLHAGSIEFKSKHFYIDDGLPHAQVNDIMQDSQGFLWFATQHGLARYDGYNFQVFLPDTADPHSISHSNIRTMAEDNRGNLWIGTADGLNKYDRRENKFYHFMQSEKDSVSLSSDSIYNLYYDTQDHLWIIHSNALIDRLDINSGQIAHYRHDPLNPFTISHERVYSWANRLPKLTPIIRDHSGSIWIGTLHGLNRYHEADDSFRPASFTFLQSAILDTVCIPSLFEDAEHQLWISTWGEGLFRYEPQSNTLSHFSVKTKNHNNLPDNFCYYVFQDNQNLLWLYTSRGLCYLDRSTDSFVYFDNPVNIPENNKQLLPFYAQEDGYIWTTKGEEIYLIHNQTHNLLSISVDTRFEKNLGANALDAFYRDSFGNLWFGREHRGVLRLNPLSQYFNHILPASNRIPLPEKSTIYAILKSRDHPSSLWVLTPNELFLYNQLQQQFSSIEDRTFHGRLGRPCNNFVCLFQDDDNSLWMGTSGTGLIHRKADGQIKQYRNNKNDSTTISHDLVWCIHRDKAGRLWIGSNYSGLSRYRDESDSFIRYSFGSDLTNVPGMWCILEDRFGAIWIGTEVGLYRYDNEKDRLACLLDGLSIFTIFEDSKNRIWLGTEYNGLGLFDSQSGNVEFFAKSRCTFSQKIDAVLEDEEGNLWCAVEGGGLLKFDPESKTFTTFTEQHGLPSNALHIGAFKSDDGTFYLSTVFDGMISFHPRDIKLNIIPPKILLTDIKIDGGSIPISKDSPLKQDISLTEEIHLDYSDNDITIEMKALHFSYPEKNQYKYWLENYDKNWLDAGANRFAVYTNLNPGQYVFHAKGANGDGIWSEDEAKLVIVIQPPWWRTKVAYSIDVILIFVLIYGLVRLRTRQLQQRSKGLEKIVQERTAEIKLQKDNVEQLSRIGRDITENLSIKAIIDTVYQNVNNLMDASVFGIGLYQEETEHLIFPATKEKGETLTEFSVPLSDDNELAVWCFKNQAEVIINDYGRDYIKYIKELKPAMTAENPESILYLPLLHKEKTIGVITAQSFDKNAFTDYHLYMLRNLATYSAIALENADAYRQVHELLNDLKSTQDKLVTQSKLAALGALTAGIAHEIKNPLNFVNNFAVLTAELVNDLREEINKNRDKLNQTDRITIEELLDTMKHNTVKINEHGKRADSIIKSMLQHSRGKSGERQLTDINAMLEEDINLAYHGMRAQDGSFNIKIETDLDPAIGKLEVVPQNISRVFLNILSNACYEAFRKKQSTNAGFVPLLSVTSRNHSKEIEIRIRDNGNGVPTSVRDKLFTPFFTTKPASQGTGLGLSISYEIVVHEHNGHISFDTEEGKFTEFVIKLPRTIK